MNTKLAGVIPVLATTFREDGSIDLDSQSRLTDHVLDQGAHGLALFGNAGEGYALLPEERAEILKLVQRTVNGRVPIVVSSGWTGTDAAIYFSKQAEDLGADGLLVLPPYYLRSSEEDLLYYFEAIGEAVEIPIMIQDAPLMTQINLPVALLARMAREIERVEYVKVEAPPTAPKVASLVQSADSKLTVFSGLNGQFMIEEFQRGARGVMPGSDMTSLYVKVWRLLEEGDLRGAWQVFLHALPLIRFELQPGMGVSAMKHNLVVHGVIRSAKVRHPTTSLGEDSLCELEVVRSLAECGVASNGRKHGENSGH